MNNWGNAWTTVVQPAPTKPVKIDPRDNMSRDELLVKHEEIKTKLSALKEAEMDLRKYIVKRAFPNAKEGTNTLELGNGYSLKAVNKYNYNLVGSNTQIEETLNAIAKVGNRGNIVAERLISWTPNFLLTEYRLLQDEIEEGSIEATTIMKILNESRILEIKDAAPTLEVKEPKGKSK